MAKPAKSKYSVDFSGVPEEIGRRSMNIPPGTYVVKIVSAEERYKDNDTSNVPYLSWKMEVAKGQFKGVPLYFITSFKPEALFNLRNLINAALGKNVAGRAVDFKPSSLYGKLIEGVVDDDEYVKDGKSQIRSKLVDVAPLSDSDDEEEDIETEEEEDEEPEEKPKAKKKDKKKKSKDDDEDLEDVDLDEI